jgi:pantoate kinase
MVSQAEAFCPGHVTAFFEVCPHEDPLRMGSRGAGLCLALGVRTKVRGREAHRRKVRVFLNGEEAEAEVTRRALAKLLGAAAYEVHVESRVDLPVSQGFGMSGAGALSAVLAANEAFDLGRTREECVALAHAAEVECGTGLGDVYPASLGGMDLRVQPGGPPHGEVRRHEATGDVLLCIAGPPRKTRTVLDDPTRVARINDVGRRCVEAFALDPSLDNLFRLGRAFAEETGLASPRLREAMGAVQAYGMAAMSMLGNSLFAMGPPDPLRAILVPYGPWRRCAVDTAGARLL